MKTMEHHTNPLVTLFMMLASFSCFLISSLIHIHFQTDVFMKIVSFLVGMGCSLVVVISHWDKFRKNIGQFLADLKYVIKRILHIK